MKYSVAIFIVVMTVFFPARHYEFLRYDDHIYIEENAHMRDGLTAENCRWALTSCGYASNWHPLTWISLMADVSIDRCLRGGSRADDDEWLNAGSRLSCIMHMHNIVLHAANTVLLYVLLCLIAQSAALNSGYATGTIRAYQFHAIMALLALMWGVHPLRNEVVCWVTERKELTSVFFMLLTLIFYFYNRDRVWGWILPVVFFSLALLAKPVAVTLPAIIFAWDWIVRKKIRWGVFLAFMGLSLVASYLTLISQADAVETGRELSMSSHVASVIDGPVIYLIQTFWPVDLSIMYPHTNTINPITTSLGILLLIIMLAVCLRWLTARTTWSGVGSFAVAWCYVGLLPMIGLVKVGPLEHSDRYTYWVSCGIVATLSLAAGRLLPLAHKMRERFAALSNGKDEFKALCYMAIGALLIPVLVLSSLARADMPRWQGTIPLFRDALPKFWTVEIAEVLANELLRKGYYDEAEDWLRSSVVHTHNPRTLINLASFLFDRGQSKLDRALGLSPYAEPLRLIEEALEMEPENKRALELKKLIEDNQERKHRSVQR